MDGSGYARMGNAINQLIRFLAGVIMGLLGTWKLIDLLIWLAQHVRFVLV